MVFKKRSGRKKSNKIHLLSNFLKYFSCTYFSSNIFLGKNNFVPVSQQEKEFSSEETLADTNTENEGHFNLYYLIII